MLVFGRGLEPRCSMAVPSDTRQFLMLLSGGIVRSFRWCAACQFSRVPGLTFRKKLTPLEPRRDANLTVIDAPACLVSISPVATIGFGTAASPSACARDGVHFGSSAGVERVCVFGSFPLAHACSSAVSFVLALPRSSDRRSY